MVNINNGMRSKLMLLYSQISGHTVGDLISVSNMHERKAEMARQADAFIALPGTFSVTWILQLNQRFSSMYVP